MSKSVADHVNRERLWERHMLLARHGATPARGVNRQALSEEEIAARREIIEWSKSLGIAAYTDAAGNFFLRMEGLDRNAPPVLSGSHLDSQPTGGKFDGVYGVLAALEAVQAIRDAKGITVEQALANSLHDEEDIVNFTVGRLEIKPNASSVVAGQAVFSIDLRHPVEANLRAFGDRVPEICKDGISHSEAESATADDLYDGARVLAETLATLADR